MKLKRIDETIFEETIIEFPDRLIELIRKMMNSIATETVEMTDDIPLDIKVKSVLSVNELIVKKDDSLTFGINLATDRISRELGDNLYIVNISKFNEE